MRFAIVWDLPVPGGPWRTKLCPFNADATAASWVESALRTVGSSDG